MPTTYTVEYLEPSHGEHGTWYRSDSFPSRALANARQRELVKAMREGGVKCDIRVRAITKGRAPAMTPHIPATV